MLVTLSTYDNWECRYFRLTLLIHPCVKSIQILHRREKSRQITEGLREPLCHLLRQDVELRGKIWCDDAQRTAYRGARGGQETFIRERDVYALFRERTQTLRVGRCVDVEAVQQALAAVLRLSRARQGWSMVFHGIERDRHCAQEFFTAGLFDPELRRLDGDAGPSV